MLLQLEDEEREIFCDTQVLAQVLCSQRLTKLPIALSSPTSIAGSEAELAFCPITDGRVFLKIAPRHPQRPRTRRIPLQSPCGGSIDEGHQFSNERSPTYYNPHNEDPK